MYSGCLVRGTGYAQRGLQANEKLLPFGVEGGRAREARGDVETGQVHVAARVFPGGITRRIEIPALVTPDAQRRVHRTSLESSGRDCNPRNT